jgi:cobalt-zinc-cadmium efflux system outer membrane protein
MHWQRKIAGSMCLSVLLSGCAGVDLRSGFSDVDSSVQQRLAMPLFWNNGTELDQEVSERLGKLISEKLSVDRAVQIALLNNRELQAVYSDLGVAQADLVQAGLLKNPLFDAVITFPFNGGPPDLELTAVMSFLDIFYLPLRKRLAESQFEEAKSRVTAAVLDVAGQVRSTFYDHQANEQILDLRQSIVQSLEASMDVTQRLYQAGNISHLDLARERVLLEGAKLRLRSAEIASRQSREQLNILMGLWGKETEWQTDRRLPEIPQEPLSIEGFERVAIERSLDLVRGRQRIVVAGEQLGLNRAGALAFDLDGGARGDRNEGAWAVGPALEFPIPLFDQGQARVGRAAAELRRAQQDFYALAVRIRAAARAVADRLQGARDRALYYRDVVLPLQELVVNEAQLHYNAMQLGPIELLRAREQQIEAAGAYVEALRDYWTAYGDYQQLLSGRLAQSNAMSRPAPSMSPAAASGAGH